MRTEKTALKIAQREEERSKKWRSERAKILYCAALWLNPSINVVLCCAGRTRPSSIMLTHYDYEKGKAERRVGDTYTFDDPDSPDKFGWAIGWTQPRHPVQWSVGQSVGHLVIRTWLHLYLYKHSTASKQVRKIKILPNERLREYDLLYVPLGSLSIALYLRPWEFVWPTVLFLCASPHSTYHHSYVDAISIHIPIHSPQLSS